MCKSISDGQKFCRANHLKRGKFPCLYYEKRIISMPLFEYEYDIILYHFVFVQNMEKFPCSDFMVVNFRFKRVKFTFYISNTYIKKIIAFSRLSSIQRNFPCLDFIAINLQTRESSPVSNPYFKAITETEEFSHVYKLKRNPKHHIYYCR